MSLFELILKHNPRFPEFLDERGPWMAYVDEENIIAHMHEQDILVIISDDGTFSVTDSNDLTREIQEDEAMLKIHEWLESFVPKSQLGPRTPSHGEEDRELENLVTLTEG